MHEQLIKMAPKSYSKLSTYKKERLCELLQYLQNNEHILGVLWGGSITYKEDVEKSDVDLFCLINQVEIFENVLKKNSFYLTNIDVIIYQGSFPWTEKLYTLYYKKDIDFSIDVCLINSDNAESFFWEPDGYILFDKLGTIEKCRTLQMSKPDSNRQPFLRSNPFSLAVITLKKIEKNLSRNHLWNAIEQLSILRRYIMQIFRLDIIKDNYFLGRVDRDIEDIAPFDVNEKFSKTVAVYDTKDIASKTIQLIEITESILEYMKISNEKNVLEWVTKQLKHEKNKLFRYII